MENPLEKVETAFNHRWESIGRKTNENIHNRLQAILYQEMTNEMMEQALTEVLGKVFGKLMKRYWLVGALCLLGILGLQVFLFKIFVASSCR